MWQIREAKKPSLQVSKQLFDATDLDELNFSSNNMLQIDTNEHKFFFNPLFPDSQHQWLYKVIGDTIEQLNSQTFQFKIDSLDTIHYCEMAPNGFSSSDSDILYQERVARKLSFFMQLNKCSGDSIMTFGTMRKKINTEPGVLTVCPSYVSIQHNAPIEGTRKFIVGCCGGPPFV